MEFILILVLYIILLTAFIHLLTFCIQYNKSWNLLFFLESLSIFLPILIIFVGNILFDGLLQKLTLLGKMIMGIGPSFIFFAMFIISICFKIIEYEKINKKHYSPIILITCFIFSICGFSFFSYETVSNWNVDTVKGVVVHYNENSEKFIEGSYLIEYCAEQNILLEEVDVNFFDEKFEIGDVIDVSYSKDFDGNCFITNLTNAKIFYSSCWAISLILLLIRYKEKFRKKEIIKEI